MNVRNILLSILYFLSAVPTYYLYEGSISIGGFGFMYCYLAPIPFIVLAFGIFLVNPDVERMIQVVKMMLILAFPLLLTVLYSFLIWIANFSAFRVMTRGLFFVVYQLIAIAMAGAATYCFGKRAVYYQMAALLIAFLMVVFPLIREGGMAEFLRQYVQLILSGSAETGYMMQTIERAGFAHGIGIYIFYLILTWKENKINLFLLLIAIPVFLTGFKRSALVGISVGLTAYLVVAVTPKAWQVRMAKTIIIVMLVSGLAYIAVVATGLLGKAAEMLQIDSMGRVEIYESMRPYYEFNFSHMGRGLGFVSYMIWNGLIDVGDEFAGDIHNDLLRQYIELGMIGFIVWIVLYFYWRLEMLAKSMDMKYRAVLLAIFAYCFGCYLTENMYYNFRVNLAIAVVIFSYAFQRMEEHTPETGGRT